MCATCYVLNCLASEDGEINGSRPHTHTHQICSLTCAPSSALCCRADFFLGVSPPTDSRSPSPASSGGGGARRSRLRVRTLTLASPLYPISSKFFPGQPTCQQVCESTSNPANSPEAQYGYLTCVASMHIYKDNEDPQYGGPFSTALGSRGLKTLNYGVADPNDHCDYDGCGPNFCCCAPTTQSGR